MAGAAQTATGARVEAAPTTPAPTTQASPSTASRRAPRVFLKVISFIHRILPGPLRRITPVTFIGYAIINGSAFVLDIAILSVLDRQFSWYYPVTVTVGYAAAGVYSLLLNRWLNFQSHGNLATQGWRYGVGLVLQYLIFILGMSTLLHEGIGLGPEVSRVTSACCEGVFFYLLIRLWVFRGTPEPTLDQD